MRKLAADPLILLIFITGRKVSKKKAQMESPKLHRLTIRLKDNQIKGLQEKARLEETTVSELIRHVIERIIAEAEKQGEFPTKD